MRLAQRQPAGSARKPSPRPAQVPLAAAIVCTALAWVGMIVSLLAAGRLRLASGVGAAALGVLAMLLATLWHRRRLDKPPV